MSESVTVLAEGTAVNILEEIVKLGSNEKTDVDGKTNKVTIPQPKTEYQVYLFQPGEEENQNENFDTYDPETRNAYVRKVMFITFVCFLITALAVAATYNIPFLYEAFKAYNLFLVLFGMLGGLVLNLIFTCFKCTSKFPANYISLSAFVLTQATAVAAISVRFRTHILLYAFLTTTFLVFVCLCLACTNFDFTSYLIFVVTGVCVVSALASLIMISMLSFNFKYTWLSLGTLAAVTVGQTIMLILNLQMILGGKAVEIAQTEHVYGAFLLYSTIISLFILMLQILGIADLNY